MIRKLYAEEDRGMTRVALVEDGVLMEYYIEHEGQGRMTGSVYMGRVQNVLPGMQAAFVDIGTGCNAFLYLGDVGQGCYGLEETGTPKKPVKLRVGQDIMVQVVKEPEGQKGPRVTTHITVPGRFGVLITDMDYIGVSRRIENEFERDRLRAQVALFKPDGVGMILRTAAEGLTAERLRPEFEGLMETWNNILQRAKAASVPRCIHRDDTLLRCTVRDLFTSRIEEFILADEDLYACAKEQARAYSPELLGRMRAHDGTDALFDAAGINAKAEKALNRKVWLKNGGYLIIDHTEALTVIDVNTGKYVGGKDLQDTVYNMNIEAVDEIARQLRLRDVGGIIVIDFIDMQDEPRRAQLVDKLRCALKNDRNKTNLVGLTGLGLVEMTRKKTRASLACVAQKQCGECGGSGRVLKAGLVARKAIRDIERRRSSGMEAKILLTASREVIEAINQIGCLSGVIMEISDCCGAQEVIIEAVIE